MRDCSSDLFYLQNGVAEFIFHLFNMCIYLDIPHTVNAQNCKWQMGVGRVKLNIKARRVDNFVQGVWVIHLISVRS